jgi:RNA polymerase sigma-70 factor (ECF subfamily)
MPLSIPIFGSESSPVSPALGRPHAVLNDDPVRQVSAGIPYLRAFARALTRNVQTADSLVQNALEKNRAVKDSRAPYNDFSIRMLHILRTRFLFESRRKELPQLLPESERDTLLFGAGSYSDSDTGLLVRCYWELALDDREVLMLVGVLDLGYEETAQILECKMKTLRNRLMQAREKLQALIQANSVDAIQAKAQ